MERACVTPNNMWSERKLLLTATVIVAIIVASAVVAMQSQPTVESSRIEDLPVSTQLLPDPTTQACEEAGGTVTYFRSTECAGPAPSVWDVCGFGVPCFTDGQTSACHDVKVAACACDSDAQCPDSYYCGVYDNRCYKKYPGYEPSSVPPKPLNR